MGRPKKRQRTDEGSQSATPSAHGNAQQQWQVSLANAARHGMGSETDGMDGAMDISSFDAAFTPGGDLQPWLLPHADVDRAWDFSVGAEHAIPALTPDSSSNSPPTLNLPPELSSYTSHVHSYSSSGAQSLHAGHRDSSTSLLLDPTLSGANLACPPNTLPTCACLSTLYLTLNTLQSMDPGFKFPFALHPLREAMQTASEVLSCEQCPQRFITAIQNTQLIGTLLMSIAERFSKVLESITSESLRADQANETKKFRLADLNTSTSHLHTGGLGCAAAFSIDLSPSEWRSMTKKVVRAEVHGPSDGNNCCVYFLALTKQMAERQNKWHQPEMKLPDDMPRDQEGVPIGGARMPREDHVCLKLVGYAEKLVEGFDWS